METHVRTTPEKAVEGLLTAQQIINNVIFEVIFTAGLAAREPIAEAMEGMAAKHADPFVKAMLGGLAQTIRRGEPTPPAPLRLIAGGRDDAA